MLLTHGGDRGKSGVREKRWGLLHGVFITKREKAESVTEEGWVLLKILQERRVGFIENTARRHRQGGRCEVTVTSGLHTQKDQDDRLVTTDSIFFCFFRRFCFSFFCRCLFRRGICLLRSVRYVARSHCTSATSSSFMPQLPRVLAAFLQLRSRRLSTLGLPLPRAPPSLLDPDPLVPVSISSSFTARPSRATLSTATRIPIITM